MTINLFSTTPTAPRPAANWEALHAAGSPKTSTRALRRGLEKLARRAVKKAGAK